MKHLFISAVLALLLVGCACKQPSKEANAKSDSSKCLFGMLHFDSSKLGGVNAGP